MTKHSEQKKLHSKWNKQNRINITEYKVHFNAYEFNKFPYRFMLSILIFDRIFRGFRCAHHISLGVVAILIWIGFNSRKISLLIASFKLLVAEITKKKTS